jgi:hypothetical protein
MPSKQEVLVEHGPKGGVVPEELRNIRVVSTLMGEENDKGERHVRFPTWFHRTGARTAEVDTGLGLVTVRCGSWDEQDMETNQGYLTALDFILEMPAWYAEYDISIKGKKGSAIELTKGDAIPDHVAVRKHRDPLLARKYFEELLPPSLLQMIVAAIAFMGLPPIQVAVDEGGTEVGG